MARLENGGRQVPYDISLKRIEQDLRLLGKSISGPSDAAKDRILSFIHPDSNVLAFRSRKKTTDPKK